MLLITPGRENNFNFLRYGLAILVLFAHSYPLSTGQEFRYPNGSTAPGLGWLAVNGFFAISGFLITGSWIASRSAGDFLRKRVLRIYPGYLVAYGVSMLIAAFCSGFVRYARSVYWSPVSLFEDLTCLGFRAMNTTNS